MADVFISYARQDLAFASRLKTKLDALGLVTFFDVEGGVDAGQSFPERIADAVISSKAVLACWTPYALTRPWVRRECFMAREMGKLVPVALAPLTVLDLKEFVDASYESLADFADAGELHFGWSQTLASLARRLELWAETSPGDLGANDAVARAKLLKAAATAARPPLSQMPRVPGVASAASLWDRLRDSNDIDGLTNFAESFPGTAEGFEARNRVTLVRRALAEFRETMESSDVADMDRFLQNWPDYQLKGDVLAKRQRLLDAQELAEQAKLETEQRRLAEERERQKARLTAEAAERRREAAEADLHRRAEAEEQVRRQERAAANTAAEISLERGLRGERAGRRIYLLVGVVLAMVLIAAIGLPWLSTVSQITKPGSQITKPGVEPAGDEYGLLCLVGGRPGSWRRCSWA